MFLSRRAMLRIIIGIVALAMLLAVGFILAPVGVQSLLLAKDLHVMSKRNQVQRAILEERVERLMVLQRRIEGARLQQRQMSLILGAQQDGQTTDGLGGFPEVVNENRKVPEAVLAIRRAKRLDTDTKALLTLTDELARFAQEHQELTRSVPSICPLPVGSFVLTSPYGERISPFTNAPHFHSGIDLAARQGTKVLASGDGRVIFAGRFPLRRNVRWWRYGNVVVLEHDGRYLTIYAHLDEITVGRGERVQRGDQVGAVGNTGWSTSPHLHYEVRVREIPDSEAVPMDPRIYILNYQWKGHEERLIKSRDADPPAFDPLPPLQLRSR
jgi:murein DD-endopeptidase MepM/ murein hydrolase activator NlpD